MEANNALLPAMDENWQRALCIAAHPDDIEYGTAAAVARWTSQGKDVTYLLATRGEAGIDALEPDKVGPLREAEERDGARAVGVDIVEFLDYPDGVVEYGVPLRRDLTRAIRRHRPDVVISGVSTEKMAGGMPNQADHRTVGLATLDAARDAGNRWIFPELRDEGLEPWPGVRAVYFAGAQDPTCGVDVTDFMEQGIASLRAHRAYIDGLGSGQFDPAAFLGWLAGSAGPRLGVEAAALFEEFRLIPDGPPPWVTPAEG